MITVAVSNQKGGTGKTATTHNLAYALRALGYSVVAIDLDPQASLTAAWGREPEEVTVAVADCLMDRGSLAPCLRVAELPWPCLIAADSRLAAVEEWLVPRVGRENYLRRYVTGRLAHAYDLCLIDCPPHKGVLTFNALTAADLAIVPARPSKPDIDGTRLFLSETVREVREAVNPGLQCTPLLITQYVGEQLEDREIVAALDAQEVPRYRTLIPRTVRVAEAMRMHRPLSDYAPTNPAAIAYDQLAQEIVTWLAKRLS